MLYRITDGTLAIGGENLLEHFDFEIKGRERIAITGPNGSGKTTFLRLIAGELFLERDDRRQGEGIYLARNVTIGMLRQQIFENTAHTVQEEMMVLCPSRDTWDRERFEFEQEYDRIFTGFGFAKEDKEKLLSDFSGGEQTKIAMVRLPWKNNILLLDEPTNHLDMESVRWLENYLQNYSGAVVMVSHDRYFIDETAEIVYELTDKKLVRYVGNYTQFRQQKLKNLAIWKKQYEQQQAELERLNQLIERFKHKPKKAAFARSKKKLIERMEKLPTPPTLAEHIFTGELVPAVMGGKWVAEAEELKIGYDGKAIAELSLRIRRGQKIGIIGPNGAGKTTFLKTVAGLLAPVKGKCQLGLHIEPGYFDQQSAALTSDKKVLEHFHDLFPAMPEKDVRNELAAWLFEGADVQKTVSDLSGGEKARLVLAEILEKRPNFLMLDEPTNHMDIPARETLESAFRVYKGTMLFISHDRYFIEQVADALLIFENGQVSYYPFGYRHYMERLERMNQYRAAGVSEEDAAVVLGQMSAEDQALIAGLKNVPKGATLLGHELSTDQAFLDWQLRLAAEAMADAAEKVENYYHSVKKTKQDEWEKWIEQVYTSEDEISDDNSVKVYMESGQAETDAMENISYTEENNVNAEGQEAEILNKWYKTCLDWYDIWGEIHPYVEEQKDTLIKSAEILSTVH
ncbi:MAG: ABC-F family ATP-binding cassette domain-containing protein [Coprococcus sp.]